MLVTLTDIANSKDFISALGGIDTTVPARIEGRKTHHTETYIACRLLATLAVANRLTFPLSVTRRDPPDDRPDIFMRTGNTQVGIEITEAIPEQFAALSALAEREFPDHWLHLESFPWNAESLSKDEMRELVRRDARSAYGWSGDAAEKEWALFMSERVKQKRDKLAKTGFQLFDENWLAIYDNLPRPHINLTHAIKLLKSLLADFWGLVPAFNALFVEHGPVLAKITKRASERFDIPDLWMRHPG